MTSNSTHNWHTPDRIRKYCESLHLWDTVLVTLVLACSLNCYPPPWWGEQGSRSRFTLHLVRKQRETNAVINLPFLLIQSKTVTKGKVVSTFRRSPSRNSHTDIPEVRVSDDSNSIQLTVRMNGYGYSYPWWSIILAFCLKTVSHYVDQAALKLTKILLPLPIPSPT